MGYYTQYVIKITGIDNANQAANIIREYDIHDYDVSPNGKEVTASFESKWYDWLKDSVALSSNYPQILIEIKGEGEENGDIWKARIRNGDSETVSAKIVFDEFKRII